MKIGDFVQLVLPSDRTDKHAAIGRVLAIEHYEDDSGVSHRAHVRWIKGEDSSPGDVVMIHGFGELKVYDP